MALVSWPFFSVWASGSIGKSLNCRALGKGKFVMAQHKRYHSPFKEINTFNKNVFTARMTAITDIIKQRTITVPGSPSINQADFESEIEYIGE